MAAEAWTRQLVREDAAARGVKIMNMHTLNASVEQFPMRRGRLMAAQATVMQRIDLKEVKCTPWMDPGLLPLLLPLLLPP